MIISPASISPFGRNKRKLNYWKPESIPGLLEFSYRSPMSLTGDDINSIEDAISGNITLTHNQATKMKKVDNGQAGKPVIRMSTSGVYQHDLVTLQDFTSYLICIVFDPTEMANYGRMGGFLYENTLREIKLQRDALTSNLWHRCDFIDSTQTINTANLGTIENGFTPGMKCMLVYHDGAGIARGRLNGLEVAYSAPLSDFVKHQARYIELGAGTTPFDVDYFCMALYYSDNAITLEDIERLEGFYMHEAGINSLLPEAHPYKTNRPLDDGSFISPTEGMTSTATVLWGNTWSEAATVRYTFRVNLDVTDKPTANGLLLEKGANVEGVGVGFDSTAQVLKFAFGDGAPTTEGANNMILELPYNEIPPGDAEWVFACQAVSNVMKGVIYRNGVVMKSRSKAGAPTWVAGSNAGGFGAVGGSSVTAGVSSAALAGVTVNSDLTTYHNVKPSTFDAD